MADGRDAGWAALAITLGQRTVSVPDHDRRRTGRPHRIEIWFAAHGGRLYLLSGGRGHAHWVRNIQVNPQVTVELGDERHVGMAHVLERSTAEDQLARELLVVNYADSEDNLDEWGRTSLPVVIEFPAQAG